jgi:hypothetical protein
VRAEQALIRREGLLQIIDGDTNMVDSAGVHPAVDAI